MTAILIVMAIGLVVAAIVTSVAHVSADRIRLNEQAWIREHLDALVPAEAHDNDMLADKIEISAPDLFGTSIPAVVYRARKGEQPVAVVVRTVAPDGYRGPIELLVAINREGVLLGVQVLKHNETPGLTDLLIVVNGRRFMLSNLDDGEVRYLDVTRAMLPGDRNTISLEARGKPDGSALVIISDQPPAARAGRVARLRTALDDFERSRRGDTNPADVTIDAERRAGPESDVP